MIIKATASALALILTPVISLAHGDSARGDQPQSCPGGTVWDVVQQTCVKLVNS